MREMAAVREPHPQQRISRLHDRQIGSHVGLRPAVQLNVCMLGTEQLQYAIERQLLCLVDPFAAAVVTPARIALGVLVGEHRPHGLEHSAGDEVL